MGTIATLQQGNNGSVLQFNLKDINDSFELDGASVDLIYLKDDEEYTKECSIDDVENKVCSVTFSDVEIDIADYYFFQLKVTFPNGDILKTDINNFIVNKSLDAADITNKKLLISVKAGLSISGTYNDAVLTQKMLAVTNYMTNAGVSDANLYSDLGIACVCVGVTDLWNLTSGEIKFSPVFGMLVEQLAVRSIEAV